MMPAMSLWDCSRAILLRYLAHDYEAYNVIYCLLHKEAVSDCAWALGIQHWRVRSLYNRYYQCLQYADKLEAVYDWIAKSDITPYTDSSYEKCKCGAFLFYDRVTAIAHISSAHMVDINNLLRRMFKETWINRGSSNGTK